MIHMNSFSTIYLQQKVENYIELPQFLWIKFSFFTFKRK